MKKIRLLTLVLMTLVFGTAKAQIQKGNIMVGSDITDLGFLFQNNSTVFQFNLNPKVGWFIKDGLAVGGYVDFGLRTQKDNGSDVSYGIGAFARYYIEDKNVRKLEFSKRTRFFLEANAGLAGLNPANGASTNGLNLGLSPGLSYFITPNIGLDAMLNWDITVGGGNSTTANRLGISLGFQIFLPTAKAKQIYKEEMGK
ncbi:hypothetical protein SAMN05444266_106187 [Chitinophaga jiangningensis]|uniref:Outer membrane protein beta-barrel domain-containing protein n=1 Tax=Chitinophaga jiangningensis TaxID=1419482 RepID=A0A1M7FLG0_9BACT|nr:hypothetical protein [Chitinophaga jiangningensis]SHM04815.1 hypothetical protein SAMN05444266_106187 [Chitinophaga jiangningensis]